MSETRPVRRIFISSTAIDLVDARNKVRDAVLRLENLPIAMETFSAGGNSVEECTRLAAEADAVVCIVAHRYGYVPPKELGGDGEKSITWLEVEAAQRAGKPVFAFLVDPKAPWTQVKEQDRLVSEPQNAAEVFKAVQKLQEFKSHLNKLVRPTFSTADELAKLVAITLANFSKERATTSTARVWHPLFCHALQPAQHFCGRAGRLAELKDWLSSPVTPDRVLSLVAVGGTGKTALVHEALHSAALSNRAGLFVWSFYEDPKTDAFLRAAYLYFTGEKDAPAGGMLERLQMALSGDTPHVLVLDGLERVQSEGDHRRRGELEDLQLKRLVRALAGGVGAARALVTSRFPMVDLDAWNGAGHRTIVLDDLERPIAVEVLRAWKVKGDDGALTVLIQPFNMGGTYHALSVAVLGSYLGNFAGGDPAQAPDFSQRDMSDTDPKARKLNRILEQYAAALTPVERDLLARMALFPRGVKVEILGWIVQSGGEVAGALIGLSDQELAAHLERLKRLGLVFRYETGQQVVYSAHPFLRDFFRKLLVAKPESIHESVRAKLAPSLEARPAAKPKDVAILDQYELLIEETFLAGRILEAFELYWYGLGNFDNLGKVLGDNIRGLRILERFLPSDDFSSIEGQMSARDVSALVSELGLIAQSLGDLSRARRAFGHARELNHAAGDYRNESVAAYNLAELELHTPRFSRSHEHAEAALSLANKAGNQPSMKNSLICRASSSLALGNVSLASADFHRATELNGEPLYYLEGVLEAESKAALGERGAALAQTETNRETCAKDSLNGNVCRCDLLLARLLLPENAAKTAQHLTDARAFANRSGDVELQLRCSHAACDLQRHLGDYPQAIGEADAGILLADTCGYGKYSIDLRIALAETYLAAGDARKALQKAREALDRSEHPDCQYAWGRADGLHFCGLAHLRLGEIELARQRLTVALEIRERLTHGRIEETRRALEKLPPKEH